jgi:N-methylhydantoinase B
MLSYQANGIGVAVEAIESDAPVVVLRHEPVPDTAGAGTNRGGASMLRDSLWLTPAQHHLMSLRYKRAAGFGVHGGRDGMTGGIWLWDEDEREPALSEAGPDSYADAMPVAGVLDPETNAPSRGGVYHYPYRVPFWETRANALLRYVTAAGGGWGDPLEREPERVLRDVRDGYVTIAGAARDYGVVVVGDPEEDPEGLVVDAAATDRLRMSRDQVPGHVRGERRA